MKDKFENMIKVTFLGDITCDRPMLYAAKQTDGSFDFSRSLEPLKEVLLNSNYVIGNLETVCAGESLGYNPGAIIYNSPDSLLTTLKDVGINMVTTANNHCLDCGSTGLERTIQLLDDLEIAHTGTWKVDDSTNKRYLVQNISGIKVAFVSFTDCLNKKANGTVHSKKEWEQVNQLRCYENYSSGNCFKELLKCILPMEKIKELKAEKNRKRGIKLVKVRTDNEDIEFTDIQQIQRAINILKAAKQESDFVVACIHCGGQFNAEPGIHSIRLYDMIAPYADAIIGNHPHVVQRLEISSGKVRAYSLGSLNMSPSADYVSHEFAPEYSVALNLYLGKDNSGKVTLNKVTFSLIQAVEDDNAYVTVSPIKANENNMEMWKNEEIKSVFKRLSGKEQIEIVDEILL